MNLIIKTLTENKEKLVELMENISKLIGQPLSKSEILDILHRVSYYTENFFINEELFLKKYDIPSFKSHSEEHKNFVEKMIWFQKRLENDDLEIGRELFNYLNDWYRYHILKSDNTIIEFIEHYK